MFAAAGQHQVADLHRVAAVGRHGERQQRIAGAAKIVVVGHHAALAHRTASARRWPSSRCELAATSNTSFCPARASNAKLIDVPLRRQHAPHARRARRSCVAVRQRVVRLASPACGRSSTCSGCLPLSPPAADQPDFVAPARQLGRRRQLDFNLRRGFRPPPVVAASFSWLVLTCRDVGQILARQLDAAAWRPVCAPRIESAANSGLGGGGGGNRSGRSRRRKTPGCRRAGRRRSSCRPG